MINLIHIGVDSGRPSCCPNGKFTCSKLTKSLSVGLNGNVKAVFVKYFGSLLHSGECRVIVGSSCDGKGIFTSMSGTVVKSSLPYAGLAVKAAVSVSAGRHKSFNDIAYFVIEGIALRTAGVFEIFGIIVRLGCRLRICPRTGRHRSEDKFCGICGIVRTDKRSIHCVHNSFTNVKVGNVSSIDTDITVTVVPYVNLTELAVSVYGSNVLSGSGRIAIVNFAVDDRIQKLSCADDLISNVLNLSIANAAVSGVAFSPEVVWK